MTLRVPTNKASEIGMRSLSSPDIVSQALKTLTGKAKAEAGDVVAPGAGIRTEDQFG